METKAIFGNEVKATEVKEAESAKKTTAKTAAKTTTAKSAAKTTAKKTAAKAEAKETVKEAAKTTAKKATTAKAAVKKTASKAVSKKEVKTEVFIQYNENQTDEVAVMKKVEADLKALKVTAKDIKLYIKPQDNACYYVADGKVAGKVDLF